ncbi:MAG: hypothetical protein K9H26_05845 [Prolixibacteraceae bacterium]|nr:hypothetical protein [Prolixibacteraceae bacterium]
MKNKIPVCLIIFVLAFTGCSKYPKDVKDALSLMSKANREKFRDVFNNYKAPKDSLKLKAAYFLVENMQGKGFYKGRQLEDFNVLFDVLANKPADYRENLPWYSNELNFLFDSLENIYGPLSYSNMYFVKDEDAFTAESFTDYIDEAFKSWENPWSKNKVSFDDFLHYVLPYRNFKEPLEPWREMYTEKFYWIYDSVSPGEDIISVANRLNVGSELKFSNGFGRYIVPIAPGDLLKAMYGTCADNSNHKAMIMRAFGIPVAIDFLPQYGNDHNSHYWNAVKDRYGNFISFEEALDDINAFVAYKYKIGKVFRKSFSKNKDLLALLEEEKENTPSVFSSCDFTDVTNEYVATTDVRLKLKNIPQKTAYVYAALFNDHGWSVIDFTKIEKDGFATFKNLGRGVLYLPVFSVGGNLIPAGLPFNITPKGYIKYIEPINETEEVILTRKYHFHKRKLNWLNCLKGGIFEGSNTPEFQNAVTLAMIEEVPGEHITELKNNIDSPFRYYRFRFSNEEQLLTYDGDGASIAEIEFITPGGEKLSGKPFGSPGKKYNPYTPDKCFDGDHLTFFEDSRTGNFEKYVGLELKKSQKVDQIRFIARNDMNSIQVGNLYELFYWDNQQFQSLGKKIATSQQLIYSNVPKGALLWLRNLTEGKEERIFTFEKGEQVWW